MLKDDPFASRRKLQIVKYLQYGLTYAAVTVMRATHQNIFVTNNVSLKESIFPWANKKTGRIF